MATNVQTITATITTEAGDVELRATVTGDRIAISQCYAGSWHHAGDGKIRDGKIVDCAARLGLADDNGNVEDATEEAYEALEEALADALSDTITRTEPHRDGSGTIIGLDCYSGGPGSAEVLVGLATPEDNLFDGTVRIDGAVYSTPFGTMERLSAIGDDLKVNK